MADTLDIEALRGGPAPPLAGLPAAGAKPTITDLTANPTDLPPGLTEGYKKLQTDHTARVEQASKEMLERGDHFLKRAEQQYDATGVSPELYQKWDAQQEFDKRSTDPVQSFGSLGSVFGILASAFTHAPMENALNASAAAMNAIKEGDKENYGRAFASYKENLDVAFKRHQMEREHYLDAFHLFDNNMALGQAKIAELTTRFGDQKAALLAQNGMWPELWKLMEDRNRTAVGAYHASNELNGERFQNDIVKRRFSEIDQQYPPETNATENMGAKQFALQMLGNINGTDIPHQLLGQKQAEFWQKNRRPMTFDESVKAIEEVNKAQRAGLYSGTARAATNATFESVASDVRTQHPEWSEGQVRLETEKQMAAAKKNSGNISDDDLKTMAQQYRAGDTSVAINLSKPDLLRLRHFVADSLLSEGKTGADQAHANAAYQGERAAQRTAGVSGAKIAQAATEANDMLRLVHEASDKVPRGRFVHINELIQKAQTEISDPKLAALRAAINTAVNTYSRAVSPTGAPTDATRAHSRELLNMAESPEALESVMQIMKKEMVATIQSPQKVREMIMRGGMSNLEEVDKNLSGVAPGAAASIPPGWSVTVKP